MRETLKFNRTHASIVFGLGQRSYADSNQMIVRSSIDNRTAAMVAISRVDATLMKEKPSFGKTLYDSAQFCISLNLERKWDQLSTFAELLSTNIEITLVFMQVFLYLMCAHMAFWLTLDM